MMLNLRIVELVDVFLNYLPVGSIVGLFFLLEIYYILKTDFSLFDDFDFFYFENYEVFLYFHNNLLLIGEVFFNYNNNLIIIASLILFVSMIASITLTFSNKPFSQINVYNEANIIKLKRKYISFWHKY